MELTGKITNTSFRNGKRADGSTWEAVDYWIIEQGVRYGSEFQFTLFGDNMKAYALRKGAEGLFAFKLASVMRNGFSHLEVTLTGFKGKDHDREGKELEKCMGIYAEGAPSATSEADTQSPDSNDLPY
jgi:hypothetical protein